MNAAQQLLARVLRGRAASRLLAAVGIDAPRFWLLVDLFRELSERREMFTELGRNGVAVKTAAVMYFLFAGAGSLIAVLAAHPSLTTYFAVFMAITGLFLLSILLPETSNSLVNPVEAVMLAHQPINGATYTAAKLTHLLRILLYLVPGLNAVAAIAGLALPRAHWYYPVVHLLAAFAVGLLAALFCCALFGWLMRFVPPPRLKAVGHLAEVLPLAAILFFQYTLPLVARLAKYPVLAGTGRYLLGGLALVAVAVVVFGLRALSGDYLLKASGIVTTGDAHAKVRRSWLGKRVAASFGGQESRAGFEYVARSFLRDWQFRRQIIPVLPMLIMAVVALRRLPDVFLHGFSPAHVIPHLFGLILFFSCNALAFGSNHECGWFFLLAPGQAFGKFARGIHAFLWIEFVLIPHVFVFALLASLWGTPHAALFAAYSLALASAYLGLELRLIEGLPFSKQPDPKRGAMLLPIMLLGGIVMALLVGVQYAFVFRSPARVAIATVIAGTAAFFITRTSLDTFAVAIRYNLGLQSAESGSLYIEL